MLCASSLRPVAAITRAGPLSLAGRSGHRATALSDHVNPGTDMLGGKGAWKTRGQRSLLLPPANAAPAGDEHGGGQSGPPALELKPNFFSRWSYTKEFWTVTGVFLLAGLLPISLGLYYIGGLYYAWFVYLVVVGPLIVLRDLPRCSNFQQLPAEEPQLTATAGQQEAAVLAANDEPYDLESVKILKDGSGRALGAKLVLVEGQAASGSGRGSNIQLMDHLAEAADRMGLSLVEISAVSSPGKQGARVELRLRLGTGGGPPIDPQAAAVEPSGAPRRELTMSVLMQFIESL